MSSGGHIHENRDVEVLGKYYPQCCSHYWPQAFFELAIKEVVKALNTKEGQLSLYNSCYPYLCGDVTVHRWHHIVYKSRVFHPRFFLQCISKRCMKPKQRKMHLIRICWTSWLKNVWWFHFYRLTEQTDQQ